MAQTNGNVHDLGLVNEPMSSLVVDLAEQLNPIPIGLGHVLARSLPLATAHETFVTFVGQPPLLGGTMTEVITMDRAGVDVTIEPVEHSVLQALPPVGMNGITVRALGLLVRISEDIVPNAVQSAMTILAAKTATEIKIGILVLMHLLVPHHRPRQRKTAPAA